METGSSEVRAIIDSRFSDFIANVLVAVLLVVFIMMLQDYWRVKRAGYNGKFWVID